MSTLSTPWRTRATSGALMLSLLPLLAGCGASGASGGGFIASKNSAKPKLTGWSTASDLSAPTASTAEPRVAVSADGATAVAVWTVFDDQAGTISHVQTATATIANDVATWGAASDLTPPSGHDRYPIVRISTDGSKATVVWIDKTGPGNVSRMMTASATISGGAASWGTPVNLTPGGTPNAHTEDVALSADGTRATAAWCDSAGVFTASATISGNTPTWGAVSAATGPSAANVSNLALSQDGSVFMHAWKALNGPNYDIHDLVGTVSGNIQTLGGPLNHSNAGVGTSLDAASSPRVAVSADGTKATLVWSQASGGVTQIQSVSATITGTTPAWGAPNNLVSSAAYDSHAPAIALSSDGNKAVLCWNQSDGSNVRVQTSTGTIAGTSQTWGPVTAVSDAGKDSQFPCIALASDLSKGFVMWPEAAGFPGGPLKAAAFDGTSFGKPAAVSSDSTQAYYNYDLSCSANGDSATAIWGESFGGKVVTSTFKP